MYDIRYVLNFPKFLVYYISLSIINWKHKLKFIEKLWALLKFDRTYLLHWYVLTNYIGSTSLIMRENINYYYSPGKWVHEFDFCFGPRGISLAMMAAIEKSVALWQAWGFVTAWGDRDFSFSVCIASSEINIWKVFSMNSDKWDLRLVFKVQ